jgi:hypothetical protein
MLEMRLGRWVVRLACVIGVCVAVFGGSAVANAEEASQGGPTLTVVPGQIAPADTTFGDKGTSELPYTTDDIIWL